MVHYAHNYHNSITMSPFFVFFFLSFFLPHDKTLFLEFYWAIALLFLVGFRIVTNKKAFVLPRTLLLLWGATILAFLITAANSRSIASSLVSIVRFIEGSVIFFLAIDDRSYHKSTPTFTHGLRTAGNAILIIFLLLLIFPVFSQYLPVYNGILATSGHHPVAYLLIALLPVMLLLAHPKTIKMYMQNLLVFIALILSAARGSWIVATAFFIFRATQIKRFTHQFFTFVLLGICITSFSAMFWLSLLPYEQKLELTSGYPQLRFFLKESNHSLRFSYIEDAINALQDRPILGHGPGTFHLISRQYAISQDTYTSYTHSLPFETLAENGIIGSLPIAILFSTVFFSLLSVSQTSKNMSHVALAWASILLLGYSTIETALNNLSMWMLFWAMSGHVIPHTTRATQKLREIVSIIVCLLLAAFVISYATVHLFSGNLTLTQSIRIAPYFKNNILRAINEATPQETKKITPIILGWYDQDPDIYYALAHSDGSLAAKKYYEKALTYHPYNNGYLKEYLMLLMNNNEKDHIGVTICKFSQSDHALLPDKLCPYLQSDAFSRYTNTGALYSVLDHLEGTDGKAKFYFFLGLSVYRVQKDIAGTTLLWETARNIAPEWGFYHLELASAYYFWYKDEARANAALAVCEQNAYAKIGCRNAVSDLTDLIEPGLRAPDIIAIPTILPQ